MAKVTVYAFTGRDASGAGTPPSRVKATREKIQALGYAIIENTAQSIDQSKLNDEDFYEPNGDSTSQ